MGVIEPFLAKTLAMEMIMDTTQLLYFIEEREAIRRRRVAGDPLPVTTDPILQKFSFTNVRREDDRGTLWVLYNWLFPHAGDPDFWFAPIVYRFVNLPEVAAEIGYPVPWNSEHFLAVMAGRAARGAKLYGPAYMIHADRHYATTAQYQVAKVFNPLWKAREWMRPTPGLTLQRCFTRLSDFHGMGGGFMPAQVIADLKFIEPLRSAPDWMTFAVSAPGSRRGLNRVLGRPVDAPWTETEWRREFDRLRELIQPDLDRLGLGDLDAQSLQSCLCELDKYERVRLGEGKPRRRFRPSLEPLPGPKKKQFPEAAE